MSLVDPSLLASNPPSPETPVSCNTQSKDQLDRNRSLERRDRYSRPTSYFRSKAYVEWLAATSLLILALPILCVLALLIAVCDGRPVFYRQTRIGKNGCRFQIWKLRTMRRDAERATGPIWSTPNDSRVTLLGSWLRATHLDELPQLFNVFMGEMSIIGPRPERPEFVNEFVRLIPRYAQRHTVLPGITGLAQVKQGYDSNVDDVQRKLSLDLQYIETASFSQDVKIMFLTVPYVTREVLIATKKWVARRAKPQLQPSLNAPAATATAIPATTAQIDDRLIEEAIYQELESQKKSLGDLRADKPSIPRPKMLPSSQKTSSNDSAQYVK
jgi:lipopolysaccharide/colanic/teichoic acid biosynthesis glycosyltransferase